MQNDMITRLTEEGFAVTNNPQPGVSSLSLSGHLSKIKINTGNKYNAIIAFVITLSYEGTPILQKMYKHTTSGPVNRFLTSSFINRILSTTLQQAIAPLIKDLDGIDALNDMKLSMMGNDIAKKDGNPPATQTELYKNTVIRDSAGNQLEILTGQRDIFSIKSKLYSYIEEIMIKFKKQLEVTPDSKGLVCVYFRISTHGTIDSAHIISSELNNPIFESIILKNIHAATFSARNDFESSTECIYTFKLTPESVKQVNPDNPVGLRFLSSATIILITVVSSIFWINYLNRPPEFH